MRLNSTLALSLLLLSLMLGAGFVSAAAGFALGRQALKGVRQPEARPTKKPLGHRPGINDSETPILLKESDILATVLKRTRQGTASGDSLTKPKAEESVAAQPSPQSSPSPSPTPDAASFPFISQDKDVKLEILGARRQGGSLLLDVSLQNESAQPIRFLYSFLDVSDNNGRPLSAIAEGLPGELPPRSDAFKGTVRIPTALLEDAQSISLMLTNYPDQALSLKVEGIPLNP